MTLRKVRSAQEKLEYFPVRAVKKMTKIMKEVKSRAARLRPQENISGKVDAKEYRSVVQKMPIEPLVQKVLLSVGIRSPELAHLDMKETSAGSSNVLLKHFTPLQLDIAKELMRAPQVKECLEKLLNNRRKLSSLLRHQRDRSTRKERRGARKRKRDEQKVGQDLGSQASVFAAMQESAKDEKKMNRKERRRLQRERAQTTQENGSGAGRDIDRSSSKKQKGDGASAQNNDELHPSWRERQKLREKQSVVAFEGKRITFSDSD